MDCVEAAFAEAGATLAKFSDQCLDEVRQFADLAHAALERGNKLLACGNGGSMCDAMHFAEEWTGRFRGDRRALPAIAFSDPAQLSCIANDFGYDEVFARSVAALGAPGDLLVALSTSGASQNIRRAVEAARGMGIGTVGLLGRGGGALKDAVDLAIVVPHARSSDRIQEIHIKVLHTVIEAVERRLFPENYAE